MRVLVLIALAVTVLMVTVNADDMKKDKKKEGCVLNGQVHDPGDIAYEDQTHCLRLKCIKRTNKKGRTKFLLKPKSFKGCRCAVPCPKCSSDGEPVCGTNNKTYVNQCQLSGIATPCGREQAELLHLGECGECPLGCPDVVKPVCGTDNITYDNECQLLQAACNSTSAIDVAHRVKCEDVPSSPDTGSQCKFNNKKFELGETIQYLGTFCLEMSCQPTGSKRPMIIFRDFQGTRSCECASVMQEKEKKPKL